MYEQNREAAAPEGRGFLRPVADPARPDTPRRWLGRYLSPALLIVLVLAVFVPALDAGLVGWDDEDLVRAAMSHRSLTGDNLWWMFTTSYSGHFQPLTWLTYALDRAVWQRETFGYHLTNVCLHIATVLAFYYIARRLLSGNENRPEARYDTPVLAAAALAAALFAVHPLRSESVAWIAERRDVLSGCLYLASVLFYLRYVAARRADGEAAAGKRAYPYVTSVALCGLSLLAKASAVTLPVVLCILDRYPLRRFPRRPLQAHRPEIGMEVGPGGRAGWSPWVDKIPYLLLALPAAAAALIAQRDGGDMLNLATHSLWSRLAQATYGLMFYPWKTLVPLGLGPLYEIPPWADLMGPMLWISLAVVIGLGVAAYRLRRTVPAIAAVLAVYAVIVFPVLGFAQSGPQLVADRYSYLSCLGFPLLMGAALQRLLRNACCGPGSQQRWILSLICVSVISVLARAGFHQNDYWLSAETLWRRGVVVSPQSSIAHTNYADALARSSDYGKAYGHYQQALRLNPADAVALHHLGDLSFATGNDNVAIDYLLQSLRIDPNRRRACLLLGRLLDKQGRYRDAARVLGDGARRHPDDLDLAGQLARLLATCPDESIREPGHAVTLALRVNRARYFRSIPALTTLAAAYAADGQFDRAVETIRRALALTDAADNPTLFAHLSDRLQRYRDEQPPSPRRG